jgi:hypothetical protein
MFGGGVGVVTCWAKALVLAHSRAQAASHLAETILDTNEPPENSI